MAYTGPCIIVAFALDNLEYLVVALLLRFHRSPLSPPDYSKTLMKVTESYLTKKLAPEESTSAGIPELTAQLLKSALDVAHRTTRVPGSSTSLLVGLDDAKKQIVALNLGDCSFLVARDG